MFLPKWLEFWVDHLSKRKREGVFICYKMFLGIHELKLSNLIQGIICKIYLENFKEYIGVVYRSQNQNNNKFESFWYELDEILSKTFLTNSLFTTILGDFNARSWSWWKEEKITDEGTHLQSITSLHNFYQFMSDFTHLLSYSNSCIELIFTDKPNLGVNCGTHFPVNCKCLHIVNLF